MKDEEKREQAIQALNKILRATPFQVEYKVKKNPTGVKVIIEVAQEQMDVVTKHLVAKHKNG